MKIVREKSPTLSGVPLRYCPGCEHGIAHRLITEAIDEHGIRERTIAIGSIGCSVFLDEYYNLDAILASHGKAPAVATGFTRALRLTKPDAIIFTYQGDGDLAAIGWGGIWAAANRGENYSAFFINNANFGMTGGQMAPTTLIGQKTTTTPKGRDPQLHGCPIDVCKALLTLASPVYIARVALFDIKHIKEAKKAVLKSFRYQMEVGEFTFVEMISACPTNWGIPPKDCGKWIEENMLPIYPLGEFRTPKGEN